ncbi:LexA family protein [Halomonas koreensis]|uniref:S24 family peptidase n=1 Tax=Halomonas koreensis TaxID=245385 RepID=A0ABU1G643_9GAMM|nr:S24 family peptidase [Halomonas koreensis]MDR5867957.1 S24 family peptidase [Halomonas koreensis]
MHIYRCANGCDSGGMDIYEIRRANLLRLMQGRTKAACADKWDTSASTISQITSKNPNRNLGDQLARKIERMEGLAPGWLDTDQGSHRGSGSVSQHPAMYETNIAPPPRLAGYVPVLSWIQAGNWQEVVSVDDLGEDADQVPRPPNCSASTFALRVRGQSMAPKYEPNLIIYVDPEVMPFDGDDVVAMLTEHGGAEATFKQLVEEPGGQRLLKARNPAWPDPWIPINGNCEIIGVVIGSLWLRAPRAS